MSSFRNQQLWKTVNYATGMNNKNVKNMFIRSYPGQRYFCFVGFNVCLVGNPFPLLT